MISTKKDLEIFGVLSFEIHKPQKGSLGGQPRRIYRLNEQQATLLVTYLGNTEPVREFKTNLVKAFFEMRDELANFKLQRALGRPKRKELVKAISEWQNAPKHAHSTITNLLLKGASGLNKRQLTAERGGHNGIDSLTSTELIKYHALEDMAIALINLNMEYQVSWLFCLLLCFIGSIPQIVKKSSQKFVYTGFNVSIS